MRRLFLATLTLVLLVLTATAVARPEHPKPHPAKPKRAAAGITIAAVGDTMLGNAPELPGHPGTYLDLVKGHLRQPGGSPDRHRGFAEVRRRLRGHLLRLPHAAELRPPSRRRGIHRDERRQQPRLRLRPGGSRPDDRRAPQGGDRADRTAGRDHGDEGGRREGRLRRIRAVRQHRLAAPPGRRSRADPARRPPRRDRRRRHPRGAEGVAAQHVTGQEEHYLGEDRGNPKAFATMAVRAGADLVLGSGPHVLRGMEIYRGRLIAYSLGNFSGFHNFDTSGVLGASAVLHVSLDRDGAFRSGRIASVRLVEAGRPVPDPSGEGAALVRRLSREDLGKAAVRIGGKGRILGTVGG